jgi:hypothetical protein
MKHHTRSRIAKLLTGGLLAPLALVATAVLPVSAAEQQVGTALLTNIRVAQHPTYDRVVLDLTGPRPTVDHRYVDRLIADGSGRPVRLPCAVKNEKFLAASARPAAAHNDAGKATYHGRQQFCTPALRNVRAIGLTGDFEGVLSVGLGLRHRSWVHVFTLSGPTRMIIDIGR